MEATPDFLLRPIGYVRSTLTSRSTSPRQGNEGAPNAWLEIAPWARRGCEELAPGQDLFVLTWLHEGQRDVLEVHPRDDLNAPLTGVFATRSSDRPNPIGLHRVRVVSVAEDRIEVGPIEAIDGTPIVDLKPVIAGDEG